MVSLKNNNNMNEQIKTMHGMLYQPTTSIIIDNIEYDNWCQYDDFEGLVVRKICLKE
jgi:hypothetical protein